MRILYLAQIVPYPLDSGARVRQYHMLQYLAQRHEVTLVCFSRPSDRPASIEHLRTLCRDVRTAPMSRAPAVEAISLARSLITSQPFNIVRDDRRAMKLLLSELVQRQAFDVIHADQLSMAQYGLWARRQTPVARSVKMTLDAHNAYYLIPQRMADVARNPLMKLFLRREAGLTARYESRVYRQFDDVLTVTDEDLASIRRLPGLNGRAPRFTTVPICVDASLPPVARRPGARGLLMLGGLHWPPNADATRWFAAEIWPLVRAQAPDARLFIVGARPPDDIRALGDCVGIRHPDQAGDSPIVVTGYVDDATPFLEQSAMLIVALRSGGGMRVKIVEALQWGLPIVTTRIGCEGIAVADGHDVLIADDAPAFAQSVIRLLRDRAFADRLSANGRQLVAQKYDWRSAYAALDAIYAP